MLLLLIKINVKYKYILCIVNIVNIHNTFKNHIITYSNIWHFHLHIQNHQSLILSWPRRLRRAFIWPIISLFRKMKMTWVSMMNIKFVCDALSHIATMWNMCEREMQKRSQHEKPVAARHTQDTRSDWCDRDSKYRTCTFAIIKKGLAKYE